MHDRRCLADLRLGRRVLWSLAFLAAAIALGVVVLWILPALIARHPSRGMTAAERLKAVNDVRAPLVAFLVAVGAGGTLWFTARTYLLNREGQITERFTRAITQIGDDQLEVRIGGLYALEKIARDSSKDAGTIIFILGAYIRHRAQDHAGPDKPPPQDVITGLRIASRLLPTAGVRFDLTEADLRNARLPGIYLAGTRLVGAILKNANLTAADLERVDLRRADLSGAVLRSARLSGADLRGTTLSNAELTDSDLTNARVDDDPAGPSLATTS